MRPRRMRGAVAGIAVWALAVAAASGNKLVVVGKERVFLGEFPASQSQTVQFELRNTGSEPVDITGISKACGCAESVASTNRVAPGATTTVTLQTIPRSLVGPFSKSFYVVTTAPSPQDRVLQLTVAGRGIVDAGMPPTAPPDAAVATNTAPPAVGHAGDLAPVSVVPVSVVPVAEATAVAEALVDGQEVDTGSAVTVEFFVQEGCAECVRLRREFLPDLAARHGDRVRVVVSDTRERAEFMRLLGVLESRGIKANEPLYMVVDSHRVLSGWTAIRRDGLAALDAELAAPTAGQAPADLPVRLAGATVSPSPAERLYERFSPAVVAAAGLADGLNPCAFTTIVFLTTLLAAGGRRGRAVFLGGLAFCLASFATYFLIGLGLLSALRRLEGLAGLRRGLEWSAVAVLIVLGALSLRDAWRYQRTGDSRTVTLQLPDGIKQRIRRFARARWHGPAVFGTGLACGIGVTLLESVCTGQLYLPTLVYMSQQGGGTRSWGLLTLYNVAFIVPLFGVFVLGALGVRSQRLASWSARNVVPSKLLLAAVFLTIAAFLALRAV